MTVNQESVEQTKQQIRTLVNEIATLSKGGAPAEEYYPQFLQRIISALAAVGGAVWLFDEDRNLRLQYQINVSQPLLEDDGADAARHNRLVRRVASSGQSLLIPPYSGTTDDEAEGNPTRYLLVMAPLKSDNEVAGLIEVFQRPDAQPKTQQGYLRFLLQMCELAAEWLKGQQLRTLGDRQTLWQQADGFARAAHDSLDLRETAFTVANEGRRLIGCDRVSVALKRGRKCRVEAISGQDTIENRSNIVASLNKLATRVVAAGEPLWYDGNTEDLPPQIEEAIEDYVDQSYGRMVAVLPLREPSRDAGGEERSATGELDRDDAHKGEVIGALIVEQIETDLPPELFRSRVGLIYEHGTRAIANARQHNNLFLMPLWRTLGRATWIVRARTLPKTVAITALITAIVLALVFVPIDFDLEADGVLRPNLSREVFAPQDGEVIAVAAQHGMHVSEGDELAQLRNRDLEVQITDTAGQIQTTTAELLRVESEFAAARRRGDDLQQSQLKGEEAELKRRQQALAEKLAVLQEKREQLTIRAPIDGQVATWEVEESLRARPVMTGQVLMTVISPEDDWHIELEMPEARMSHLDAYMAENEGQPVPVEYILATDPDRKLQGHLVSVEQRAEPKADSGSVVRLRVEPHEIGLLQLRPGAKVVGDVKCGRRPAGYVWFYQLYEWVVTFLF